MKIAHINISDLSGGAAKACYRLHLGLLRYGIESRLFVMNKISNDSTVTGLKNGQFINRLQEKIDKLPLKLYPNKIGFFFSNGWLSINNLLSNALNYKADIIHLHWVGNSLIQISKISKLKTPLVWSLHDMWAFTGGCHNNNGCTKYLDQCGKCPVLNCNYEYDLSRKNILMKKKYYDVANLSIIGLSKWITNCAKASSLLINTPSFNLPNCLDTNIYKNAANLNAKNKWNFPVGKTKILCASINPKNNFVKGFKFLGKLVQIISERTDLVLIFIGKSDDKNSKYNNIYFIDPVLCDLEMINLYNSVDMVVHASIQENLSNVIMESMACGKPVVAFNVGGNSDLIDHKINGYLATPFAEEELVEGIFWLLKNNTDNKISMNAREKIVDNFSEKNIIPKYIRFYEKLLNKK